MGKSTASGTERLLVIDRDPVFARAVAAALAGLGADLVLASSFDEASVHVADPSLAVILAAERPGWPAASLLRKVEASSAVKILLLPERRAPVEPEAVKAIRFVVDPFVPENLEAMVREVMSRRRLELDARRRTTRDRQVGRLENRQRLLDAVVVERTREIEEAYGKLKVASREAIQALAQAIEARDPYTKGHSARVARFAVALARETRYPEREIETLEFAAFLHDVGKIGVRDAVLLKPGPLDEEEWKHMRTHPQVGYEIANKLEILRPLVSCIRNHHERWDGKGYPDGLSGEDIPLIARIVAIADAFDAMNTDRPYKEALTLDQSVVAFRKQRAIMYDPRLTDLFIERVIGELKMS